MAAQTEGEGLEEQVIFAVLLPMARLAARFGVPLRRIKQLSELAYYQELRRLGLRMRDIQDVMSIGFSKVGTLSRQLKVYHARPDSDFGLQRRILLLLWALPLTEKHLLAAFPEVEAEVVRGVLREMVSRGRLEVIAGRTERFGVVENHNLLLQDGRLARLSALGSLMTNAVEVIEARFFARGEGAFARTLNFRVRAEDVGRLEAFYREALIPLVQELDEAVERDAGGASAPIKLSMMWARDTERDQDDARGQGSGSAAASSVAGSTRVRGEVEVEEA